MGNFTVYKITNKKTGNIYVGGTSRSLAVRASEHKSHAMTGYSNGKLQRMIRQYGWENFSIEIIESCDSREMMHERERFWIEKLGANKDENYNGSNGNACLSEQEVRQIKLLLMSGTLSQKEISLMYSVSYKTISHINCGRLWSSVNVVEVA